MPKARVANCTFLLLLSSTSIGNTAIHRCTTWCYCPAGGRWNELLFWVVSILSQFH